MVTKIENVAVLFVASSICSDLWGPQLFSAKYCKVMDKVRHWLHLKGSFLLIART